MCYCGFYILGVLRHAVITRIHFQIQKRGTFCETALRHDITVFSNLLV